MQPREYGADSEPVRGMPSLEKFDKIFCSARQHRCNRSSVLFGGLHAFRHSSGTFVNFSHSVIAMNSQGSHTGFDVDLEQVQRAEARFAFFSSRPKLPCNVARAWPRPKGSEPLTRLQNMRTPPRIS